MNVLVKGSEGTVEVLHDLSHWIVAASEESSKIQEFDDATNSKECPRPQEALVMQGQFLSKYVFRNDEENRLREAMVISQL